MYKYGDMIYMGEIYIVNHLKEINNLIVGKKKKDILFVEKSYIFKFPFSYISVDMLSKLKGPVFRKSFFQLHKAMGIEELISDRFYRPIRYMGNFKWFYSALFGICEKKRIIIYPYLKTEELPYRIYRLNILIEYFKKNDYIFIVPIEKGADVSCLDYID